MPVPAGVAVDLGERGDGFVRIMSLRSFDDAVPLVLLHGLTASSGINWFTCFGELSERRTVIAPDLCGHGRGPAARRVEDIDDYALDVVALLDVLGVDRCTVIGFFLELIPDVVCFEAPTDHSGIIWEPDVAVPFVHTAIESAEARVGG